MYKLVRHTSYFCIINHRFDSSETYRSHGRFKYVIPAGFGVVNCQFGPYRRILPYLFSSNRMLLKLFLIQGIQSNTELIQ